MPSKGEVRGHQPMTLKARAKKLTAALDRSGSAFNRTAQGETKDLRARTVFLGHSSAYATMVGFLKPAEVMTEDEVNELLKGLVAVCADYAAKEMPEEPEPETDTVEDTHTATLRWLTQGQLATYRQMKLQLENVLTEHQKAAEKRARKTY